MDDDLETGFASRALLIAHINLGSRVVAYQKDVEAGRPPGPRRKRLNLRDDLGSNRRCGGYAIESSCWHGASL